MTDINRRTAIAMGAALPALTGFVCGIPAHALGRTFTWEEWHFLPRIAFHVLKSKTHGEDRVYENKVIRADHSFQFSRVENFLDVTLKYGGPNLVADAMKASIDDWNPEWGGWHYMNNWTTKLRTKDGRCGIYIAHNQVGSILWRGL